MPMYDDAALDALLDDVRDNAEQLVICSQEPADYTEAYTTYKLGTKTSPTIADCADASPDGRGCEVQAFSDGSVSADGTATHWALIDVTNTRLLAADALDSGEAVVNGNPFSLNAFWFIVRDPT